MVSKKGVRRERQFAREVDERGGAVMKSPASGSATKREQPDHIFSFGDGVIVDEFKTSSGGPIYVDAEEVEQLLWVAEMFGAKAYIVTRFDGDTEYYFHRIDQMHETPGGNYRMKDENRKEKAETTLSELAPTDS